MKDLKMLAIDLGASSGRGIVGSFDGKKLTLRENHRFSNDPVTVSGPVWWHEKSLQYEKDAPAVKFGYVVISKLK